MSALGNLVVSLALETAAFTKGLEKSSYEAQKFAQGLEKNLNRSLNLVNDGLKGFASGALGAVGVALSAQAAFSKLNDTFVRMDDALKASQKFGIAVEELSKLQFAAKLSGVETDKLGDALKDLLKNAADAGRGVKAQKETFDSLGVSVKGLDGNIKPASKLIEELAGKFANLPDGAAKSSAAMKVFGESGLQLIPLLNAGEEGLRKMNEEAERFGLVVTTDAAKAAELYSENLRRLTGNVDGLFISIGSSLLPVINSATESFLAANSQAGGFLTTLEAIGSVNLNSIFSDKLPRERQVELRQQVNALEAKQKRGDLSSGGLMGVVDRSSLNGLTSLFGLDFISTTDDLARAKKELALVDLEVARSQGETTEAQKAGAAQAALLKKAQEENLKRLEAVLKSQSGATKVTAEAQRIEKVREQQLKALAMNMADYQKQIESKVSSEASQTLSVQQATEAARKQALTLVLNENALRELELAKIDDQVQTIEMRIAMAEYGAESRALIPEYMAQIQALKDLKEAKQGVFVAEDQQKLAEDSKRAAAEAKKAFESITGDISSSITNAIADGSIKGRDFLKRLFSTTVVRVGIEPFIKNFVGSVVGAIGLPGAASAAGFGDLASLATDAHSIYKGISGTFSNLSGHLESAGDYLAKTFYNSSDAVADFGLQLGDFASANSAAINQVGAAAGAFATVYAGYSLGRSISGGYSLNGGTGNSTVNTGAALGAVVGSIIPGIGTAIGAALGSLLGGTVNRLFGRKKVLGASGIEGSFTEDSFSGRAFQDVTLKGGLFRSSKSFTEYSNIAQDALDLLGSAVQSLTEDFRTTARIVGVDVSQSLADFELQGRFNVSTAEALQATLKQVSDAMIGAAIPALKEFQAQGEALLDTARRVAGAVATANQATILLGQGARFYLQNADAAMTLISSLGESGLSNLQFFVDNFLSSGEQIARSTALLTASIRQLGLETKISVTATNDEFKALVQSLDLTTEAGLRELTALLSIAPALDALNKRRAEEALAVENLSQSISKSVLGLVESTTSAIDEQINLSRSAADQARTAAVAYRQLNASLKEAAQSLLRGVVDDSTFARYQFDQTYAKALGGDLTALNNLGQQAQLVAESIKSTAVNRVDQVQQTALLMQQVDQAAAVADVLGVGADFQAGLFDVQTAALEVIKDQLLAGNLTADILQQQSTLLQNIAQMITSSANLTVGAIQTAGGETVGALFDSAGNVVGQLSSDTVLQIQALVNESSGIVGAVSQANASLINQNQSLFASLSVAFGEASSLTASQISSALSGKASTSDIASLIGAVDSNRDGVVTSQELLSAQQIAAAYASANGSAALVGVQFSNSITGQTGTLTGLSQQQIQGLQGLGSTQSQALNLTGIVAQATDGSETLLGAVLNKLSAQDAGSMNIVASLNAGNIQITNYLSQVVAAINQQSAAQAAELKRQQDLEIAQNALVSLESQRQSAISQVSQAAGQINPLASQFGVTLRDSAGGQADFGVDGIGRFIADFQDILFNVGNEAGVRNFKNSFYGDGGLYDQTYGRASELQNYLTQLQAQRDLITSLGGVPAFANGGAYSGGLALVGEEGPELINFRQPGMVYTASQSKNIMAADNGNTVAMQRAIDKLESGFQEMQQIMRAGFFAVAKNTQDIRSTLRKWDNDGQPEERAPMVVS